MGFGKGIHMKKKKVIKRVLAWMCLCLLFMGMAVYADETEEQETTAEECSIEQEVKVKNWNRRIYELQYEASGSNVNAAEIRTYVGKNFHITDGVGNILSEGTFIDKNGDSSGQFKRQGKVCRDINGWYILWEKPDLSEWGSHKIHIQRILDLSAAIISDQDDGMIASICASRADGRYSFV